MLMKCQRELLPLSETAHTRGKQHGGRVQAQAEKLELQKKKSEPEKLGE